LHMKGENQDTRDADEKRVRELCDHIGIKCEIVEYVNHMKYVKEYFVKEYLSGRTPNPCVVCNREVKFKPFLEYLNKINADFFATGHYALINHENNLHYLKKAVDENKDQTYFLCQLSQNQLEKALFPLGNLTKQEVRKIAEENGLISAQTKDSYDICFLGSQKFKDFMNKNYPEKNGDIIDIRNKEVVGKHNGVSKYTLGQRKNLGVGGKAGGNGESWFVVDKDIINNIVFVTQGEGKELLSVGLISNNVNWIPAKPNESEFRCKAKFRYRQEEQDVVVKILENGLTHVAFDTPQRAITPGQYVVFYKNDFCLGGGVIDKVLK